MFFAVPGRPRVLILSHSFHDPEQRKMLLALAEHVDVRVVAPKSLPEPKALRGRVFKPHDLDVSSLARHLFIPLRPIYRPGSPFIAQYGFASVALGVRRVRPDVIHLDYQPWSPIFWQALLARRLFAPRAAVVLAAKKNTYRRYPGLPGRLKAALTEAGLRRVDWILAASTKAADLYATELGFDRRRIDVLTHVGVDPGAFAPAGDRPTAGPPVTVGFCGRLEAQKGVPELVEAVERCRADTGAEVRLRLVGSGSLEPELAALAGERPWLSVEGPLPSARIPAFLAGLDVFVLPARVEEDHEEHDAHALLEALTVGVAGIGTRSGAIVDVLGDGTGVLVEPEDPAGLARALAGLVRDPEARAEYAARGRRKAQAAFVNPVVARRQADLYAAMAA
jgi:glycosyltransferase involved in cell wall biosynthesis